MVSGNIEDMIDGQGHFRPEVVLPNLPFRNQVISLVDAACKDTWIVSRIKDLGVPIIMNGIDQAEPLLRQMLAR